jgi:hypothetical protein
VGYARPEVPRGVDGVACRPAERQADAQNEQAHEQREDAERKQIRAALLELLRVTEEAERAEGQYRGADDLGDEVGDRVVDGRGGAEDAQLESLVIGLLPVREVGQPHDDGADEGPEKLGDDVARDYGPGELPYGSKAERDGRVDEAAADAYDCVNGYRHPHRPPEGDDDPTGVLRLGVPQEHAGHDAVTENDQQHRANELA